LLIRTKKKRLPSVLRRSIGGLLIAKIVKSIKVKDMKMKIKILEE
jgi:hypothetical protein